MIVDYLLVYVLALLSGGWSVAAGITFGLNPIGVWVMSSAGSLTFMAVALGVGGPIRDRLAAKFASGDEESKAARSKAQRFADRWGDQGLAAIGPVILGPTITLSGALILGVNRRTFAAWYTVGTLAGFGALTVFWSIVR